MVLIYGGSTSINWKIAFFALFLFLSAVKIADAATIAKPTTNLGLAGYWKLNENTGTALTDSSGNGNTLSTSSGAPNWVNGKLDKAIDFNGDYASINDNASLSITGPLSISVWYRYDGKLDSWGRIVSKAWSSGVDPWIAYGLQLDNDTVGNQNVTFSANVAAGMGSGATSVTTLQLGVWYHIVGVFDPANKNASIYINGVRETSNSTSLTTIADTTGGFRLASDAMTSQRAIGVIDEVRVYRRALRYGEVKALYQNYAAKVVQTAITKPITVVQDTGKQRIGANKPLTFNMASLPKIGNYIIVTGSISATADSTITVSDNQSNTWGKAIESPTVGIQKNVSIIWYTKVANSSGTFTITVTNSGAAGSSYMTADAIEVSGLASSGVLDVQNSNSSGSATSLSTGSITTTAAKELIIAAFTTSSAESITVTPPGGAWTNLYTENAGASYETGASDYQIVSAVGNYSATYTSSIAKNLTAAIQSFKAQPKSSTINSSQNSKITNGLVGLWSFNGPDMSGNTAFDRSGNANNGTLTNGPARVAGKIGQALNFDGGDDYVNAGSGASLNPGGSNFTISAWIKSKDTAGAIVCKDNQSTSDCNTNTDFYILEIVSGEAQFQFSSGDAASTATANGTSLVNNDQWHHIVGVRSGPKTAELYVDGIRQATATHTGSWTGIDSTSALFIGTEEPLTNFLSGLIDEVRVYNRALTPDEIKRLYNMGR